LKHSCQIVVVVYRQQIAIFVCVKYVELDAVDAVQSFDQLVELVELVYGLPLKSESAEFGVILN
jgi:hypothetical protein